MAQQQILLKIGQVSKQLGLSTHTIRAWERRYHAVEPVRTPAGGRLYPGEAMQKLAAIRDLAELGHGVGTVARLPLKVLRARLDEARKPVAAEQSGDHQAQVTNFLGALGTTDHHALEAMTREWGAHFAARDLVLNVVAPIVEEVGQRWCAQELRVGQEHLSTGMMRRLLDHLLGARVPAVGAAVAVAATLSGERHELGLQMACVMLGLQGWRIHYLGPDVPVEEITHAVEATRASMVLLSLVNDAVDHAAQVADLRAALHERVTIVAGGRAALSSVSRIPGVQVMALDDLDARFVVQ